MCLGSRQVSRLTIACYKGQSSNSLFVNCCNRTIDCFLKSSTWRGLTSSLASASCKMILQAKPTSTFFDDKVFSLLRTSILESLAAIVASPRTDFLINLLKSVHKIVYNSSAMNGRMGFSDSNFFRKGTRTFAMVTKSWSLLDWEGLEHVPWGFEMIESLESYF